MSTGKPSALVIVGTPDESLERALVECGLSVAKLPSRAQAEARLAEALFDVVLLPVAADENSLAEVAALCAACTDTAVIAFGPEDAALTHAALRAGAGDAMRSKGIPMEAATWQGLTFYWERVEIKGDKMVLR